MSTVQCGIVGLPNVGKSTLFNALTKTSAAQAANFPFCTIEPNTGRVAVPDGRLDQLAGLVQPENVIPTSMEFVDIAGLVAGAHKGEGLGNQFLANIREVAALAHVVRCFENDDITHVAGKIDPIADIETIKTELMLADLGTVEKRLTTAAKKRQGGEKAAQVEVDMLTDLQNGLGDGVTAKAISDGANWPDEGRDLFRYLNLLTAKPVLYVCNVNEDEAADGNGFSQAVAEYAAREGAEVVIISAAIEAEVATLAEDEQTEFLADLGLSEPGLNKIIRASYKLLDLVSFFTAGPKEVRAWTVRAGSTAPQAAGRIHGDFEKGFIRAETVAFPDYIAAGGEAGAKEAGKLRQEGKEYVVSDGDVFHFRFNV